MALSIAQYTVIAVVVVAVLSAVVRFELLCLTTLPSAATEN